MYEIDKPVAYEILMKSIVQLIHICGGWDEEREEFKPGVLAQLNLVQAEAGLLRWMRDNPK